MKIVHIETLIQKGEFASSAQWQEIREQVLNSVKLVDWPIGSGLFTIFPESGKKTGQGNGVKPIKDIAINNLIKAGWIREYPWPVGERVRPGNMDAAYISENGIIAFEWETGNISSSHRSMNKMALGLLTGKIIGGVLIVPSRKFYPYLTDRIGNYSELEPYLPLWRATPCTQGILEIVVIEHDAESESVPRIPKGTDGRARI